MPKMVKIGPAKGFKASAEKKADWEKVQKRGVVEVDYGTAMEAIQNSGGMYEILPEEAAATPSTAIQMPEEMSNDALKLTALQLGIDLSKKNLKRSELVAAVRRAMDAVELADEDEDDA